MSNNLIKIGCDGGDLVITTKAIHGIVFYEFKKDEFFKLGAKLTFVTLSDCWEYLKAHYPCWHQLYLVEINTQIALLVKNDYIPVSKKNEYTIDSWLDHLTGRSIGF